MQSIENKIEKSILSKPKGTLLLPEDFTAFGSSDAVRKALSRLQKKEIIKRVAHGIYVRPRMCKIFGPLKPSAEEVAKAIIKRDRIRIIPTGSFALNALGLSTQVPMNIVYLTDGSSRELYVGKRKIKFKKTATKMLMAKGRISKLVILALKEIGNGYVTIEEEKKILSLLKKEDVKLLEHDIKLAPEWIRVIMRKAL